MPCWGDWFNDGRHKIIDDRDINAIVTMLVPYLTSTEDGGAYMRSHRWRDSRLTGTDHNRIKDGYVIVTTKNTWHDNSSTSLQGLCAMYKQGILKFLTPVHMYSRPTDVYNSDTDTDAPHYYSMGSSSAMNYLQNIDAKLVEEQLTKIALLPVEKQTEAMHKWGLAQLKKIPSRETVLAFLDSAETLEYEQVAQPITIS